MNYIHKYSADGKTLYLLSESPSKPAGTFSLKQEDWQGRALGRYATVVGQLSKLGFTKKDVTEEETAKKAMIDQMDGIASSLQELGRNDIALAIDQVSDFLEEKV